MKGARKRKEGRRTDSISANEVAVQPGLTADSYEAARTRLTAISQLLAELKETQDSLRGAQEQLRLARREADIEHARYYDLFEEAPDPYVVTDTKGLVLECNRAMSNLLGRPARQIVGESLPAFFSLEDRPVFRQMLVSLQKSDERGEADLRLTPDVSGRPLYVQATVRSVHNTAGEGLELRWILRAVSSKRRAELALAESEARHRFLTEHAQDAIYLFRFAPEPHLEYVSPAISQITGFTPEDFYKDWRLARKLIHPEDAEVFDHYVREGQAPSSPLTLRLIHRSGDTVWVEQHMTPILGDDGRPVALEAIVRDVTERVKAEAYLERLRTEFLVILAHELRTPLTGIKGAAAIGLSPDAPPKTREAQELFSIIDEQAEHLRELITNLLDVAQIESGLLELNREDVDIAEMLREAGESFARGGQTHRLVLELPDELPRLNVDRRRLQQVLDNLLENAAHVSPAAQPIVLSARNEEGNVLVEVRDHGRGIPPEKLPLLFRKFYRVDDVTDKGAGLGLAICRGLVEAHGGRIWAESNGSGDGARFVLALPSVA